MSGASRRTALAALESARPLLVRSNAGRSPEDLAADLVEIGRSLDAAIRALLDGAAGDPSYLVGAARERGILSLSAAHELVAAFAAWERVKRPGHAPSPEEVAALRDGHAALEGAIAPRAEPVAFDRTVAAPPVAAAPVYAPPPPASRRTPWLVLGAVLLVVAIGAAVWWWQGRGERALERAVGRYTAGDRTGAEREFARIVDEFPNTALAHVYLGRLARERGDAATAQRELETAVRLEPGLAVANRELGAHLLSRGNLAGAQRFYARAVQADPSDRLAQGWLACTLHRQGNFTGAQRFAMRAGQGPWQQCFATLPAAPTLPQAAYPAP